jgi:poly(3-hydroxybutyrate) depolymerase
MNHAVMTPLRAVAKATQMAFRNPMNPLAQTYYGRSVSAAAELFERSTRRYDKPVFDLPTTTVNGVAVDIREQIVWKKPFCQLIHFERQFTDHAPRQPKLLIVAPMSGHYATLLRGTVETFIQTHEVYITDWEDARKVPLAEGRFDLDDYVDYVRDMLRALGGDTHVIAVCQPSVPVMAAVSLMEAEQDPFSPVSMILMGGPIDTRISPTAVNDMASDKDLSWFEKNVVMHVPLPHPGFMRKVYPGFLQISGFMWMNVDRHVKAHNELFGDLVKGDGDSAAKHRDFYDEYLAVMDLTAEFYLQTIDTVFIRHALPKGEMMHRDKKVDPSKIRSCALMTVEGEKDDITGGGQTQAAQTLCTSLPDDMRVHYVQPGVGHYGVFNGSRFRSEIAPRICDFIQTHQQRRNKMGGKTAAPADVANDAAPAAKKPAARSKKA